MRASSVLGSSDPLAFDQHGVGLLAQLPAPGVHALGARPERDIVFLWCDHGGVEAPVAEVLDYYGCDSYVYIWTPERRSSESNCRGALM